MNAKTLTIDGDNIHGIQSFYDEINRVFMADEGWRLGPSLDALNDLLYGGYGAMKDAETVEIIWKNIESSRKALGYETTRAWYLAKLEHPEKFDAARFRSELAALDQGTGPSYFDMVMQVMSEHQNIRLIAT